MKATPTISRLRRAAGAASLLALAALGVCGGTASAATPEEAPPVPAGEARVWFLRQLLPGSIATPPMLYVNGAPIARSAQGTAFYRDFVPGRYAFGVENCLAQANTGQTMTLRPDTQYALNVSQDDNGAWDCNPHQVSYLQQLQPGQVPYYFAPLTFLGAR